MKLVLAAAALITATFASLDTASVPQDPQKAPDMAEMMRAAQRYTQPSEHHEQLERFLGTWDTEMRITMAGQQTPPAKGTATFEWLMDGRWLKSESTGSMMGQPIKGFSIMGYDNFKHSFVVTMVNSMDTAMLRSEGDMDPSGKALITYGTLDEYLTGEHDKMVKYVWRFVADDEIVQEVHDLPIGEKNTQVVEVRYRRRDG